MVMGGSYIVLLLTFLVCIKSSMGLDCFVPGQCVNGTVLSSVITTTDKECLSACQADGDCEWFSFNPSFGLCQLFSICPGLSTADGCGQCTSGENECQPFQCNVTGQCQGVQIHYEPVASKDHCLLLCRNSTGCKWYTHDTTTTLCFLYSTCPTLDESCGTCMSGESGCTPTGPEKYSKILVATGHGDPSTAKSQVEIIDISDSPKTCQDFPELPGKLYQTTGGLLDQVPVICRGCSEDNSACDLGDCYKLATDGTWRHSATLDSPRSHSSGVDLGNRLLVTGGWYTTILNTSDFVEVTGTSQGPNLPTPLYDHCAVRINQTTVILTGGNTEHGLSPKTYYYNIPDNSWTPGPDMNAPRVYHACGILRSLDTLDNTVVVAGGSNSSETETVELLLQNAPNWQPGPSLPSTIAYSSMVQDASGTGVILVGGSHQNTPLNTLYHLNNCHGCEWQLMNQTLKANSYWHVAFGVPDSLVTCN